MTKTMCCTVRLLNKSYDIKCPEEEKDNLQAANQKINEHLLEIKRKFKNLDDFQALLLATLHISHELVTCQAKQNEQRQQLTHLINTLENKVNPSLSALR